jgi:pantoate--beta-alanine ligase
MIVYRTKKDLALHLDALRNADKSIGLVPTMGALHQGHTSLVVKAASENDAVVVSIFVNPTQFNDPADLEKYPSTLDQDLELLQSKNVDLVFIPSVNEMYPQEDIRSFDLGNLDKVMEGKHRKNHFLGVVQIVSKLFLVVNPHKAYFGQKDFQQLVIVRHLVQLMNMELDIVACPIVREEDGLAMSSRNVRLSREERNLAPFIYITLKLAREKKGSLSPVEIRSWVITQFMEQPLMQLEYFEIVEDKGLHQIMSWEEKGSKVGCIAVLIGEVRLIDNLIFD